jgi:GT2 family glycosyltransferase
VKVVPFNQPFNYSQANNLGAVAAEGDLIVLLNNDTEVVSPDWLEQMSFHFEDRNVSIVGNMLVYPNQTVQHAGIVLGLRGTADHIMRGFPLTSDGYAGSLSCARNVAAVTGACLMMRRDDYLESGGMVEYYATHYQDVDLCLRFLTMGKRIVYEPNAVLVHYEGATRGDKYDHMDRALLLDTWGDVIARGDPYYNPNFSLDSLDYVVA